ncbi:caspase family protein [Streptomyces sp. NBC_01233]|uniref:caspase family protein n=1 Tax=Streptomyces sp. NBC_01233 TaxID=2903787 RepID=UPI002E0DD244|nr:caspase family protein [Streptomyces sp. NBC_01233]
MTLPDPARSRAVLIGCDRYRHLADLPAVGNNVRELATLLMEPGLWGLDPERCVVLNNPSSVDAVLNAVHDAAAQASDCLVVYFAGHGLLSPDADLLLALPESDNERLYRSIPYSLLRHELVDTCTAPSRVVILDCCYSGMALQGHMATSAEVADRAGAEGTYVMTASSETKLAWSPEGEEFTAFSGELLRALAEGVPDAPDPLEMGALFQHVRRELVAKGRPVPQQRARNSGHNIALTRNRWTTPIPGDPIDVQIKTESLLQVGIALTPDASAESAELAGLEPGQAGLSTAETVCSSPIEETVSTNSLESTPSRFWGSRLEIAVVITLIIVMLVITAGISWLLRPQKRVPDARVRPPTSPCNLLTNDQVKFIFGGAANGSAGPDAKEGWVDHCDWVYDDPGIENPYRLGIDLNAYSSSEYAHDALWKVPLEATPAATQHCISIDAHEYWNPLNVAVGDGGTPVRGRAPA